MDKQVAMKPVNAREAASHSQPTHDADSPKGIASKHKQQESKQATRLLSIFAITPSSCFRLYSSLANFCVDTRPSQTHSLSPQLNCGGPKCECQDRICPSKSAQFWAENSHFFLPNTVSKHTQNTQTKEKGLHMLQPAWFALVPKSLLLASNSRIRPRNT